MGLEFIEIVIGVSSLTVVIISVIIGLIIASKYPKHKEKALILVGITWIGMSSPWYPSSVSFLSALITGQGLSLELYLLIGIAPLSFFICVWIAAFTEFLYKNKKKVILLVFIVESIVFEIIFFYYLFTNPFILGNLVGNVNIEYMGPVLVYVFIHVIIILITGILFGRESLKSDNPEIRLKGKLIILAYIIWFVSGITDAILPLNAMLVVIMRIFAIISGILFYGGFILPEWVKKLFLKEE